MEIMSCQVHAIGNPFRRSGHIYCLIKHHLCVRVIGLKAGQPVSPNGQYS